MLAACASSRVTTPPPADPDPVVEVRYETRTICPAELRRPLPVRPSIPAGAVVEANAVGSGWLADELSWSGSVASLFTDAQAACPENRP